MSRAFKPEPGLRRYGPDGKPIELAGDFIRLEEATGPGQDTIHFDHVGIGRKCGTCTLCCRVMPISALGKPAGVRCQHVRHGKGCGIYKDRPLDCRAWSCRWMADPRVKAAGLPRPDHCHYVIDLQWDHFTAEDGGKKWDVPALQIWVDPLYPDAWRAPELRRFLEQIGRELRAAAIVRFNSQKAVLLIPPAMNANGQWQEIWDATVERRD